MANALAAATPTSNAQARPGPLVTAIASTSCSPMPAVSHARSMVGTIASRCALLATSGTTPPNRACSSTLDAMASASRVVPRTMPTPVSSQEVSMPRTRGSSAIDLGSSFGCRHRGGAAVGCCGQSHDQGVHIARLVVAAAEPDGLEAEALVELLGADVVDPALQHHFGALEGGRGPQQLGQQHRAESGAPVVTGDGDRLDVGK